MDSRLAVEARNISHCYGDGEGKLHVLHDISFDLYRGEFISLSGPSGCGKTTLLTLLGGLRSLQHGDLKVLDQDLKHCNAKSLTALRSKIGIVFQTHYLMEFLTALQNVQVATEARIHEDWDKRQQRAIDLLAAVGLEHKLDCFPSMLSGGQKQRVAFARALACNPELILADEPTASLDRKTGLEIIKTLKRVAKEKNIAVVMATHDTRILALTDRIIGIDDGRITSVTTH
ncbi:ABC transporter ATP-binding protein [Vulcanococcus limneticus]|uniref:ABC transporter ATP-binding protein n=1 Tax=Vulcanococcus limneticus TaxID=2170428 RepID=UPI000B9943B9|nr:ATP-binding cassette domain-containing protein [Vulcanococcus limneticus]MCP9792835.1 ATP-binding cassette domain-containing protein [Vulcanococcus limneticus MW73D5]MCP9894837.1 ATP-binding cassette domain-containing protein [Vulcanococcus limneticus Candia 3F8]MCP9898316.1 ATP-binding cassette domain-containing protein [Vulcanococcus limneticus Candia 3B3]